jgi:hypothetical protein
MGAAGGRDEAGTGGQTAGAQLFLLTFLPSPFNLQLNEKLILVNFLQLVLTLTQVLIDTLRERENATEVRPALLLYCSYTVSTLLLHCCYTVATLLLRCCHTVVTGPLRRACGAIQAAEDAGTRRGDGVRK